MILGLCGEHPEFIQVDTIESRLAAIRETKDVAQQISLEHDLKSSDLFRIIHVIAEKARKLAD